MKASASFDWKDFAIAQAISTLSALLVGLSPAKLKKFKSALKKLRDILNGLPLD